MSIFENINKIKPHFFSLREIEGNVSLDLKLMVDWKYEEIVSQYKSIKIKIQDKSDKVYLISLVSVGSESGYDVVFTCAEEIIKYNRELELKKRLFETKLKELKTLFEKESIDKLQDLKILDTYEQTKSDSDGLAIKRDVEGQEID